jgi:hypothetical protein
MESLCARNEQGYDEIKNWKYSIWGWLGSYWLMFICDVVRVLRGGRDSSHWHSHCEHQRFEYLWEICQNCRVLVNFTIILYQCEGISLINTYSMCHIIFLLSEIMTVPSHAACVDTTIAADSKKFGVWMHCSHNYKHCRLMLIFFITFLPSSTTSLNISLIFQHPFIIFYHYGLYAHL